MHKLIRENYLAKIRPFYHDYETIKVLTGVRRCGKSTLMDQIQNELIHSGVQAGDIIYLNLDKRPYKSVRSPKKLEKAIDKKIKGTNPNSPIYLFIDEIQNVKGFEPTINSYRE